MRYFIYCRKSSEAEERQALSLESQLAEIRRAFGSDYHFSIVEVLQESMSAKAPGRPIFNRMLERIQHGEAEGIIAWHPDRLARNSVDGGMIIYLLDQRKIADLKFANFSFENSSQGKFMLQIMFGYSKYYVDNLSENVKRGNRAKIAKGWRPGNVPVGYKNCRETRTIITDPDTFRLVERVFRTALTGTLNVSELWRVATHDWGLRLPKRSHSGGKPIALSAFYRMLSNIFYTGHFIYQGQLVSGKHPPALSLAEFERIQHWLRRPNLRKPKHLSFPFTGMIRCGACGLMVTAERKTNRQGHKYIYYHCTRRNTASKCGQPSVEATSLTEQIAEFLSTVTVDRKIHAPLRAQAIDVRSNSDDEIITEESLQKAIADMDRQEKSLLDLRVRELISDDEFISKRQAIQTSRANLTEQRSDLCNQDSWFEPLEESVSFSVMALKWFHKGDDTIRRLIVEVVGSNLQLLDRKLCIEAAFPFSAIPRSTDFLQGCSIIDDVRKKMLERDEDFLDRVEKIRKIKQLVASHGAPRHHEEVFQLSPHTVQEDASQ
jgi:DNA invertase Pin-like site-specific DNA recombinase